MSISQSLLPEFEMEMVNTRKTLERVPDDKFGWKPHEKSMDMGTLAVHLATIPGWAGMTLNHDSFNLAPTDGEPFQMPVAKTTAELLALFDQGVSEARAALEAATDEQFMQPWSLLSGDVTHFTMPKIAVVRSFVMNHNVHHRAQLGVYLRLNDIPVPAVYGPSADEGGI